MAKVVAVNFEQHQNLKVITQRGAEYGEGIHLVPVVANELRNLVLEYPVCITKNPETGQFSLAALLGFEPGENLFLLDAQWRAQYIPLHIRRQPFMVGYRNAEDTNGESAVITLDMESNRVQEEQGEPLFNEDGSKTQYFEEVSSVLSQLMGGMESTDAFLKMLADNDLIEPAQLDVRFASGEQKRYEGLYTVNDEKLQELDAERVLAMHTQGYLQAAYWLTASLGQVRKLIQLKNSIG